MRELKMYKNTHGGSGDASGGSGDANGELQVNKQKSFRERELPCDFDEEDKVIFHLLHRAFPHKEDAMRAFGIRPDEG